MNDHFGSVMLLLDRVAGLVWQDYVRGTSPVFILL